MRALPLGLAAACLACGSSTLVETTTSSSSSGAPAVTVGASSSGNGSGTGGVSTGQGGAGQGGAGGQGGANSGGGGAGGGTGLVWASSYGDGVITRAFGATSTGTDVVVTGVFRNDIDFGGGLLMGAASLEGYIVSFDAMGVHAWSRAFVASSSSGDAVGLDVASDGVGGVYLSGYYTTSIDLGGGPLPASPANGSANLFLARYDATGQLQWSRILGHDGAVGFQDVHGFPRLGVVGGEPIVVSTQGGTFDVGLGPLASVGDRNLFVARFDAQGQAQWQRRFQSGLVFARPAQHVGTHVMVGGHFEDGLDAGPGAQLMPTNAGQTAFLLALDPASGNTAWAEAMGPASAQISSVAVSPAGEIAVVGRFGAGTLSLGGAPLQATEQVPFSARFDPLGQHIASHAGTASTWLTSVLYTSGKVVTCGTVGDQPRLSAYDPVTQLPFEYPYPAATTDNSIAHDCVAHPSGVVIYGSTDEPLDLGLPSPLPNHGGRAMFVGRTILP